MVKIAKKKKKSTKLTRTDMKAPDQFQEASSKGAEWLGENWTRVAAVCAAILLLALGVYLYRVMSRSGDQTVTAELTETLKVMEAKIETKKKKGNDNNNTSDSDDTKVFKTEKAKYEAATKLIQKQLKGHSGNEAAIFMRLYLANSQYQLGQYKKAMENYKKFMASLPMTDPIYIMGVSGLLRAAEAAKQGKEGVQAMETFLNKGAKAFRPLGTLRLAEYYERQNDYQKARKYYEMLADTKKLQNMSGEKKLSAAMTQIQTTAKRRLALLPTKKS